MKVRDIKARTLRRQAASPLWVKCLGSNFRVYMGALGGGKSWVKQWARLNVAAPKVEYPPIKIWFNEATDALAYSSHRLWGVATQVKQALEQGAVFATLPPRRPARGVRVQDGGRAFTVTLEMNGEQDQPRLLQLANRENKQSS